MGTELVYGSLILIMQVIIIIITKIFQILADIKLPAAVCLSGACLRGRGDGGGIPSISLRQNPVAYYNI